MKALKTPKAVTGTKVTKKGKDASEAPVKQARKVKALSKEQILKKLHKEAAKVLKFTKEAALNAIKKERADAKAAFQLKEKELIQKQEALEKEMVFLKQM